MSKRKLQGTLENFFAKRPAVEADAEETDVNSCGNGDDGVIKERALGVFAMHDVTAEALFNFILAKMKTLGLEAMNCVGQCYNGANVMSGTANGVQARIRNEVPHALYMHCYAHRMNLVLVQFI